MDNHTPGKTCATCGQEKPATAEFYAIRDSRNRHGRLYPTCRSCQAEGPRRLRRTGDVKVCRQCKQAKPKTTEFFRSNGTKPGHFKPVCKECLNLPPAPVPPKGTQFCNQCGKAKPLTEEHFHVHKKSGRLRTTCKPCAHTRAIAYQRAHPEQTKANARAVYWRNPVKFRLRATFRHRTLKASGTVTPADVQMQLKQQKHKCYWCGQKLEGTKYHMDHIIPIVLGGQHNIGNICCACPFCNHSKGAKMPHAWAGRLF